MANKKLDIRGNLKRYIPSIFLLIDENKISWVGITKRFTKAFEKRKKEYYNNGMSLIVELDIYGLIIQAYEGQKDAQRLFVFLDNIFRSLGKRLNRKEKSLIRENMYNVLTNMDRNYLNFVGELAVLDYLVKREFTLLGAEVLLNPKAKTGVKADFCFHHKKTNKNLLIEVVNIHLSADQTKSRESVEYIFKRKVCKKYNETAKDSSSSFWLIPVFWGFVEELEQVKMYFDKRIYDERNILDPFCFVGFEDKEGKHLAKFGPMASILNEQG